MVCLSNAKWPNKTDPDFATVESDLILTTSADGAGRDEFSILIDFNGNVLTQ